MYSLVRRFRSPEVAVTEVPTLAASLVVAEFFYKFHSFTLECLAFLATWAVLSSVVDLLVRRGKTSRTPQE